MLEKTLESPLDCKEIQPVHSEEDQSWDFFGKSVFLDVIKYFVVTNLDSILKSRDITLSIKVCLVKAMVFSVVMYGCESWTVKKAECQRIDAFEQWCWKRLLRCPLDYKEIQPVHPKGDQSWVFIGKTDAKAETPILWPPHTNSRLVGKD